MPAMNNLRGVDHVGIAVPDLGQAHEFLTEVLGCTFGYSLPGGPGDDEWNRRQMHLPPGISMTGVNIYRCGNGANLEVLGFAGEDIRKEGPRNSDAGGHHVALYVDDLDEAIGQLRARNVEILGESMANSGPAEGQRWIYFRAPWGTYFELVSYPEGKAYETGAEAEARLWDPRNPAT